MRDDDYSVEEEFHQRDRKAFKKERKIAQTADRSKFKKTDQDKLQKKAQHYEANPNTIRARVLSITGEGIQVDCCGKRMLCSLRGLLKRERTRAKNLIVVGDFVQVLPAEESQGQILSVEERTSTLAREDVSGRKRQLIAANIDQVFITVSILLPTLKPFLIDRYIIAAHKGNMAPVVLVNKIDLLKDNTKERLFYEEFLEAYKEIGVPILPVSAETKKGIPALKVLMKDKASVFSGHSGVGKSSLINELLGLDLPTGEMILKTSKGSHTTTTAHLIPLPEGGFCIDTPGIKSFGIWDMQKEEITDHFFEIKAVAKGCKYPNCIHTQEPECAVHEAVARGEIHRLRFESYLSLIQDLQEGISSPF